MNVLLIIAIALAIGLNALGVLLYFGTRRRRSGSPDAAASHVPAGAAPGSDGAVERRGRVRQEGGGNPMACRRREDIERLDRGGAWPERRSVVRESV